MVRNVDIQFHADGYERAKVAINVKIYNLNAWHTLQPYFERLGWNEHRFYGEVESIYEHMREDFWEYTAQQLAKEFGFSEIWSEGRGGGWLIPLWNGKEIREEDLTLEITNAYNDLRVAVKKVLSHANSALRRNLQDLWEEKEIEFLRDHSITIRSIEAWK